MRHNNSHYRCTVTRACQTLTSKTPYLRFVPRSNLSAGVSFACSALNKSDDISAMDIFRYQSQRTTHVLTPLNLVLCLRSPSCCPTLLLVFQALKSAKLVFLSYASTLNIEPADKNTADLVSSRL